MKRRRGRGGFTLTETLLTVALLAIITAAGATVSTTVLSTKNDMVDTANAQILASTVLDALADEVRYGVNVKVASDKITLDSWRFDEGASFEVVDGRVKAENTGGTLTGGKELLLGEAAYTGLKIKADSLKFTAPDGKNVVIELVIENGRGDELWEDSRTVAPLNGVTTP